MGAGDTTRVTRQWVVCADDFALDRGAIEATLALIKMGRVTATSVLVDSPDWRSAAPELKSVAERADVGLHLNLTQQLDRSAAAWRLPLLVGQSMARVASRWRLHDSVERQLDRFCDAFGRMPDFIDGHHHVHQLPVVRDLLIESLAARVIKTMPWLRVCRPPSSVVDRKARLIGGLGAEGLAWSAKDAGFPASAWLVGVYGFDLKRDGYLERVRHWLQAGGEGTVFMCHPSVRPSSKDPIGAARRMELGVLAGEAYAHALAEAGVTVVRGTALFRR